MSRRPRRNHSPAFKAKVALAGAADVFTAGGRPAGPPIDVTALHAKIGAITLGNDFLEQALSKAGWLSARR